VVVAGERRRPRRFERVSATYRAGSALVRTMPRPVAEAGAAMCGYLAVELSAERRLLTERNLHRAASPELTGPDLRRAVHRTFGSYMRYWVDSFRLPKLSPAQIDAGFAVEGYDHIERAIASGTGPILALPHLGGWEWAAFWLTQVLGVEVTAVVEAVEPQELFDFFVEFRRELGMHVVPLGPHAGTEVIAAIKQGHVACLLSDRDLTGDGVEVEFFGERTTLPGGPVTLALRTGAPLLPTAVYFEGRGHHAVIGPPLPLERRGRLRADVARLTQDLAYVLEDLIRRAPEQWHLQSPNWPSDYDALAAIGRNFPRPGDPT
jgi:phosphatidylinositol dimannoside acyltransferase